MPQRDFHRKILRDSCVTCVITEGMGGREKKKNQDLSRKYPAMYYERDIYWRRYKIPEILYKGQWHLSPFKVMTFLRKAGSLVAVWIKSLAPSAWRSFSSGSRSCRMNFAPTPFMPRSCVKISGTVVFGIPDQLLVLTLSVTDLCWLRPIYTFNILRRSDCCRSSRTCIGFKRFSTILEAFVPHFYLHCTLHCPQKLSESSE